MNIAPLDNVARRLASPATRRLSLLSLGGSGLAVLASVSAAGAGKKSKKRKKDKKKDDKKCQRQVGQCNGYFEPLCEEEDAPEGCAEDIATCCAFLGNCQAEAFIDCLMALIRPTRPEVL